MNECELYPDVIRWFLDTLRAKFTHAKVSVFDTSRTELRNFLFINKYHTYFPQWQSYAIKIDITAIIESNKTVNLAFVECKIKSITLKDISQLLGYSKVAQPSLSIILSPDGISDPVNRLFNQHNRTDVLNYGMNKNIFICKWDTNKKCIDRFNIYPTGSLS